MAGMNFIKKTFNTINCNSIIKSKETQCTMKLDILMNDSFQCWFLLNCHPFATNILIHCFLKYIHVMFVMLTRMNPPG